MKQLILYLLTHKAARFLVRHHPRIVAITGSVGKTSTRNAVVALLGGRFRVRTTIENYNNEFGVPLTILGAKSPGSSIFGWLRVLFLPSTFYHLPPPNLLVLELGVDRPDDMNKLLDLIKPGVAVFTAVTPVHVENFASLDALVNEKTKLIESVPQDGLVVLNTDDAIVRGLRDRVKAPVVTYGFGADADVRATDFVITTRDDFSFDPRETFSQVTATVDGQTLVLKNALGRSQVSTILAALAVGKHFGLSTEEMLARVGEISWEPGRLRPIAGIKGSLIIDDTYNAAPASMLAALDVLKSFSPREGSRRIAVLGKMAELGSRSAEEHRLVGLRAAEVADLLITVGEESRDIRRGAIEGGMDEAHTLYVADPLEAGRHLDQEVRQGDIVLVKGSQSARMEKVVRDIMAEPLHAKDLLVRQYGKWLET